MRKIGLFLIGLCMSAAASAQNFNDYFADKTLRLDYIFTGNATRTETPSGRIAPGRKRTSGRKRPAKRKSHLQDIFLITFSGMAGD